MRVGTVLDALYDLLSESPPEGVVKVFEPGKPIGPFARWCPALVLMPDAPSKTTTLPASDVRDDVIRVQVHIYTDDVYHQGEARARGSLENIEPITEAVEALIIANPDLDGTVDELIEPLETTIFSPAHAWVSANYYVRERR